jgi:hypothetical protein
MEVHMKLRSLVVAVPLALVLCPPRPASAVTCPENPTPALCSTLTPTNEPIKVSSNKQYLQYKNAILPLVGQSASYLCHVEQPGTIRHADGSTTVPNQHFCTWSNHQQYIGGTALGCNPSNPFCPDEPNVIQLWVSLNHSPGRERGRTEPYCYEHPFKWTGSKWDLFNPDTQAHNWEQSFFDRLRCVVQYAWQFDMIVEVTLFDPWSGSDTTGPWHQPASANEPYFRNEICFASLNATVPNGSRCDDYVAYPDHKVLHRLQEEIAKKVAATLCNYPNVYYEIANELDFTATPSQVKSWYQKIEAALRAGEQACAKPDHIFGANLRDNATIESLLPTSLASVLSGHYPQITPTSGTDTMHGAIELLRAHHNGNQVEIDRVYSFNETKIVGQPGAPVPETSQTVESARAEAWEFMLSEGGVYNRYVDRWQEGDAALAWGELGTLRGFLSTLPLGSMQRSANSAANLPVWITGGMNGYNAPDAQGGKTFWGAMHQPSEVYVLYIHHSNVGPTIRAFKRYEPVLATYSHAALKLKPNETYAGTASYLVEWFDPVEGTLKKTEKRCNVGLGQEITIASPAYSYDIALRLKRITTCP